MPNNLHEPGNPHYHPTEITRRDMLRLTGFGVGSLMLAACTTRSASEPGQTSSTSSTMKEEISALTTLPGFDEFRNSVKVTADDKFWLIESNGLPSHNMMKGITNWQQQVPLPMDYSGTNAWSLPRHPQISDAPISARKSLYRGAIALAVNGVPIFNALNNRGEDAFLIGELDEWGGHCGRADDYHYHIAPLHLTSVVGAAKPIAYALDGFPIYGATEPDGSTVLALDEFNGHLGEDGSYHYHGTTTYPYINGGLRGKIGSIDNDQIEPQPRTTPIRPAGEPLRGATITDFVSTGATSFELTYALNGQTGSIEYSFDSSSISFEFTSIDGSVTQEKYSR